MDVWSAFARSPSTNAMPRGAVPDHRARPATAAPRSRSRSGIRRTRCKTDCQRTDDSQSTLRCLEGPRGTVGEQAHTGSRFSGKTLPVVHLASGGYHNRHETSVRGVPARLPVLPGIRSGRTPGLASSPEKTSRSMYVASDELQGRDTYSAGLSLPPAISRNTCETGTPNPPVMARRTCRPCASLASRPRPDRR